MQEKVTWDLLNKDKTYLTEDLSTSSQHGMFLGGLRVRNVACEMFNIIKELLFGHRSAEKKGEQVMA